MPCSENLSLLPNSLERGTEHQGPTDHRWGVVGDPALQHCTDVLERERSPHSSPHSQSDDRADNGKGSFLGSGSWGSRALLCVTARSGAWLLIESLTRSAMSCALLPGL